MRLASWFMLGAVVAALFFVLIGRAADQMIQERTFITRSGVTLDCERKVAPGGEVSYGDCHRVP